MTNIEHLFENAIVATRNTENVWDAFNDEMKKRYNQIMLKEVSMTSDELWDIIQYMRCSDNFYDFMSGQNLTPIKEGYWIEKQETLSWCEDDVDIFYECSNCNCCVPFISNFCPDCGAVMLGEDTK